MTTDEQFESNMRNLVRLSMELQRERAIKKNLTLYRLNDRGQVVAIPAREFFAKTSD